MQHILSFCAHCGMLIPTGAGFGHPASCENCGGNVTHRENRLEGSFSADEGKRLHTLIYDTEGV